MGRVSFTVRIPKELHQRASETAAKEVRSLSSLMEIALQQYLEDHGRKTPTQNR